MPPQCSDKLNNVSDSAVPPPHEALRAARLMSGVSLRELARRIGVSPATLSAVENGRTRLSVTRLAAAATALGVSVHDVLGEVPEYARPGIQIGRAHV